jgi:hypothetical protein
MGQSRASVSPEWRLDRRKTLSGSHLQIGIEFQPWGSLPRPSASGPVWNRSAPFGALDAQPSIPTMLPHPTRPGTAYGEAVALSAGMDREDWRWVRGQRLALWESQPGLERTTETAATGQGARPRRGLATDSTGRQLLPRAWPCFAPN